MVRTLSVQELRLRLPAVLRAMQRGTRFLLIYRSKPVGELRPLEGGNVGEDLAEGALRFLTHPAPALEFTAKRSSVTLVREERRSRG